MKYNQNSTNEDDLTSSMVPLNFTAVFKKFYKIDFLFVCWIFDQCSYLTLFDSPLIGLLFLSNVSYAVQKFIKIQVRLWTDSIIDNPVSRSNITLKHDPVSKLPGTLEPKEGRSMLNRSEYETVSKWSTVQKLAWWVK